MNNQKLPLCFSTYNLGKVGKGQKEKDRLVFMSPFFHVVSSMLRTEALVFIGLKLKGVKASRQTGAGQTIEVRQHN